MKKYFANKSASVTALEEKGQKVAREIYEEGIVLLENRGFLPLQTGRKLALYGSGARTTLFGGLGAASIHLRKGVTIEEGLEAEGFTITTRSWLERDARVRAAEESDYYANIRARCGEDILGGVYIMYSEPFVPSAQQEIRADDVAASGTDTALYVISRCSGEGADRKPVPGDYELSGEELRNLKILERNYENLVVILNTCGVIDTKAIRLLRNLKALIFAGFGAAVTGTGVAGVLSGRVNPSGKLAATWAENYLDYPSADTYAAVNGNLDDEEYREGIYVGYRWFDACGIRPAYCFGHGLSYTTFEITPVGFERAGENIVISQRVRNIGSVSGKEVVQIYVSQPEGKIPKAVKVLAGYEKTRLLAPGEEQCLTIEVPWRSLAVYDESRSAWALEGGSYRFYAGNSSEHLTAVGTLKLDGTAVTEQCTAVSPQEYPIEEFQPKQMRRETDYGALPKGEGLPEIVLAAREIDTETHDYGGTTRELADLREYAGPVTFQDVLTGKRTVDQLACSLTLDELSRLLVGNVPENATESRRAAVFAAGTAASSAQLGDVTEFMCAGSSETTVTLLQSRGIPKLNIADGGSGLRLTPEFQTDAEGNLVTSGLFSIGNVDKFAGDILRREGNGEHFWQYPTAFPMAMVMAQTWNQELLTRCGDIIGTEADAYGVDVWMAPSMNIYRSPLCGRNYEYYSEDPFITGSCAVAALEGFQRCKFASPCIKHFACNNQEDNRGATNVHISERALREIYMRGFEMAVRAKHPGCLMTSLNLVNGLHMANQYDLLTTVLRDEWGFDGLVVCDWGTTVSDPSEHRKYGCSSVPGCIHAGNDLIMPGTRGDIDGLLKAAESGELPMEELRLSAKRMLNLMLRQAREVSI